MPPHAKNKCLIYANVIVSGTIIAGGQLGQVLACPEYPGRFYGRGKTGPDTDSSRKIEKSGRGWGPVWGHKVVGHMPWGALSGPPRVRGHESVFWGRCGGFRAPGVQGMKYMQILIDTYNTCRYL